MQTTYNLLNDHSVMAFNDYDEAKNYAEKQGLKLAEYGDYYGSKYSYAYWNKSGNRNDDEDVIAYYTFVNTKPAAISEEELNKILFN